jgi:hypothetical protein
MENAAHAGETLNGLAEARKAPQEIDVIKQRNRKSLCVRGVILPGPHNNLVQLG